MNSAAIVSFIRGLFAGATNESDLEESREEIKEEIDGCVQRIHRMLFHFSMDANFHVRNVAERIGRVASTLKAERYDLTMENIGRSRSEAFHLMPSDWVFQKAQEIQDEIELLSDLVERLDSLCTDKEQDND